jgi:phospholipase C
MRIRNLLAAAAVGACIAAVVAWAIPASAGGPPPGNVPGPHGLHGPQAFAHLDHVFVIMMENTSYDDLLSPDNANTAFIRRLANSNGLETNYFGVTHVSMPNYVAATSGSNWGSNSDDTAQADQGYFNHLNIVDQLEQANVSWKAYMESMPSAGYTGNFGDCTSATGPDPDCTGLTAGGKSDTGTALYTRKHDPFMLYPDIFNSPQRRSNVVPLTQLATDLHSGHMAQYVWITPNSCNDMHGGPPQCPFADAPGDANQQALYRDGDTFLQTWVTAITHSKAWNGHSAIFVTWDEGSFADDPPFGPTDTSGCCDSPNLPATPVNPSSGSGGDLVGGTLYGGGHVPMIVVQHGGVHGTTDDTATNHYSLLQTIEQNWNLPFLGNASDTVQVHSLAPLLKR